jgi:predicted LPLAT superfamily acyltransferase
MTIDTAHWATLRERGASWGLRFSALAYRAFGRTGCMIILSPVVLYFFITGSEQRQASRSFLVRVLALPPHNRAVTGVDRCRHFFAFVGSALDGFAAWSGRLSAESLTVVDEKLLYEAKQDTRGALFIVSHLGNADLSRALLDAATRQRLTILVHTKHAVHFNEMLRRYNPAVAVNTLQVTEMGPETMINLEQRIERGEWIVIAGDRTPIENPGRVIRAPFLGKDAAFAEGPYILGAILKCPVFLLFCLRRNGAYELFVEKFSDRLTLPRQSRNEAIQKYAEDYAKRLEHHVIKHPFQWYNFFNFWA